jgi:anti-sigma factor RsiW
VTDEHLNSEQISAFIDYELSLDESQALQQHLDVCHACSLRVLSAMQLKGAIAVAGRRFALQPDALIRLTASVQARQPHPVKKKPLRRLFAMPAVAWSALAASLVLVVGLVVSQQRRENGTLTAELLDQHLATLSSAASPQVISTDRHTVKPWFQGKLPFSFNLPETTAMPADTMLKGADFTYLRGEPAALLLFTIHKHQVSIFMTQRGGQILTLPSATRSGFSIRSATTQDLRLVAVSDVNPADLDLLLSSLAQAQADH